VEDRLDGKKGEDLISRTRGDSNNNGGEGRRERLVLDLKWAGDGVPKKKNSKTWLKRRKSVVVKKREGHEASSQEGKNIPLSTRRKALWEKGSIYFEEKKHRRARYFLKKEQPL